MTRRPPINRPGDSSAAELIAVAPRPINRPRPDPHAAEATNRKSNTDDDETPTTPQTTDTEQDPKCYAAHDAGLRQAFVAAAPSALHFTTHQ